MGVGGERKVGSGRSARTDELSEYRFEVGGRATALTSEPNTMSGRRCRVE